MEGLNLWSESLKKLPDEFLLSSDLKLGKVNLLNLRFLRFALVSSHFARQKCVNS